MDQIYNTVTMLALMEEVPQTPTFFKDRYFPTGAGDLYKTDYVLTQFRKVSRTMAKLVAPDVGDIPLERGTFEMDRYAPPRVAPSRTLTVDDLSKAGWGEAPYATLTPEARQYRIAIDDLSDLERAIAYREEWLCAKVMIENGFTEDAYADDVTPVDKYDLKYYAGLSSEHVYTVSSAWSSFADMAQDVSAMADSLTDRGLAADDLLLGTDAAAAALGFEDFRKLLDKNSGIITGEIAAKMTAYRGVVYLGQVNFNGHILNVFSVREGYAEKNQLGQTVTTRFFPAKSALVTAPGCGHMTYAAVTQINRGQEDFSTIAGTRIPKLVVDDKNDTRKLKMSSRPLPMPVTHSPWVYAPNVVS